MTLVTLEIASDDLLRGARRVLPFAAFFPLAAYIALVADPATASLGDLITFYRSSAALWWTLGGLGAAGLWEALYVGPARRAARWEAARVRAAHRSAKAAFTGSRS